MAQAVVNTFLNARKRKCCSFTLYMINGVLKSASRCHIITHTQAPSSPVFAQDRATSPVATI